MKTKKPDYMDCTFVIYLAIAALVVYAILFSGYLMYKYDHSNALSSYQTVNVYDHPSFEQEYCSYYPEDCEDTDHE